MGGGPPGGAMGGGMGIGMRGRMGDGSMEVGMDGPMGRGMEKGRGPMGGGSDDIPEPLALRLTIRLASDPDR